MRELIDDLLTYSRIGTKERKYELVDCRVIVSKAVQNLDSLIRASGATVVCDTLPFLPIDSAMMTQVFQNLIGNGIKFRGADPPKIQIYSEQLKDEWLFKITDNGIGIEPEYLDKIFIIFQRLHTRAEYPGTGLGLAIVKKIIERHGGRIGVSSIVGQGSTFYFTIPAVGT